MKKLLLGLILGLIVSASPVFAGGHQGKVQAYLDAEVSKWIGSSELINAVAQ